MINLNIFRKIKINRLRKKHRQLLNEVKLYSVMNRSKSDELYQKALELEDKILELKSK